MKAFAKAVGVSLLFACLARADSLDARIQAEMTRQKLPGVSIAVVHHGTIIREQGYGFANLEHQVPVEPSTIFQSGSLGKQFTAALVMLLVQDGNLGLDDPVSKHLPNTPRAWEKITIRHLLTHTSGMGDPYEAMDLRRDYTDEQFLQIDASMPLLFEPGAKWSYSNMGYQVLGFICNKAGGRFYGDQLRDRIFAPTGMKTRIISERDIVLHRAAGYDLVDGEWKNQEWVSPSLNRTADGSLYLTAHDLALWDLALYDNKVLSDPIKAKSWAPVQLNDGTHAPYGFGWSLDPTNGHRTLQHSGAWQGFKSCISRYVDDQLTVIVLANASCAQVSRLERIVAGHYVPELGPDPQAK